MKIVSAPSRLNGTMRAGIKDISAIYPDVATPPMNLEKTWSDFISPTPRRMRPTDAIMKSILVNAVASISNLLYGM